MPFIFKPIYGNCGASFKTDFEWGNIPGEAVLIEGKKIIAVIDEQNIPQQVSLIDLQGAYVATGLVDLQT